jgi:ABC-type transport system involved in cytochrome c biogenesis permease subunit
MLNLSQYALIAGLMLVVLAVICYITALMLGRSVRSAPVMAHAGAIAEVGGVATALAPPPVASGQRRSMAMYGTYFSRLSWVFLTACLVLRTISTGHGPFTNQYEFAVSFAWGMIAAYVYFEHRYHVRTIALLILPIAAGMLLYALTVGATANPLVPALQNNLLLTIHVAVAIVAYGAFSVSFAAAALYLTQPETGRQGWPKPALLDEMGYRAVIIGFPLLTMTVVLGAVWAKIAWGSYRAGTRRIRPRCSPGSPTAPTCTPGWPAAGSDVVPPGYSRPARFRAAHVLRQPLLWRVA